MTDGHQIACTGSRQLCEGLLDALAISLPEVQRKPTSKACGLLELGNNRFAYVYHSKSEAKVEVWCAGSKETLVANDPGLEVRPRASSKPGWEDSFPARLTVRSIAEARSAAQFLVQNSVPAAKRK